jgi:hypothetical protein
MARQGKVFGVADRERKRLNIRRTACAEPMTARDLEMAEALLAKLVARAFAADHPELFGPHLARATGGPGDRTYGQMTIDAAVEQTTEVYMGSSDRPKKREVTEEELASAREEIGRAKETRTVAAVFEIVQSLARIMHVPHNPGLGKHYSRSS